MDRRSKFCSGVVVGEGLSVFPEFGLDANFFLDDTERKVGNQIEHEDKNLEGKHSDVMDGVIF